MCGAEQKQIAAGTLVMWLNPFTAFPARGILKGHTLRAAVIVFFSPHDLFLMAMLPAIFR